MGNDLIRSGFGAEDDGQSWLARQTPAYKREAAEFGALVSQAKNQQRHAVVRNAMTERAFYDGRDLGELADELSVGSPVVATVLYPILQEWARATARDVRTFG